MAEPQVPESDQEAIARAIAGDRAALECLLLAHHDRLAAWIARRLPDDVRGALSPEDVLQEAFVAAFRHIESFRPRGKDALFRWLRTIAWHRLLDVIKAQRAAKRGRRQRAPAGAADAGDTSQSVVALLDLVAVDTHTPSKSVVRREEASAVQVALAGLQEDYRQVLRLRYIKGLPVAEVAARMNRSERAVQMLSSRALKKLGEALTWLRTISRPDSA